MHAGVLTHDAGLVVEERIEIGLLGDRPHHGAHQERQERQLRLVVPLLLVERRAELLKLADIDLLDIGDVGNAGVRDRHLLGDPAAQADHLDLFDGRPRLKAGRSRQARSLSEERIQILMGDAAGRASAGHLPQVDAGLARPETNRRRGQGLLAFGTRSAAGELPERSGAGWAGLPRDAPAGRPPPGVRSSTSPMGALCRRRGFGGFRGGSLRPRRHHLLQRRGYRRPGP